MWYKSEKEIWYKIVLSYEGDEQVKREKLQTLRIQYENLRMHNNESVANYFLHVDEIFNCMKNLGEEIKEAICLYILLIRNFLLQCTGVVLYQYTGYNLQRATTLSHFPDSLGWELQPP